MWLILIALEVAANMKGRTDLAGQTESSCGCGANFIPMNNLSDEIESDRINYFNKKLNQTDMNNSKTNDIPDLFFFWWAVCLLRSAPR